MATFFQLLRYNQRLLVYPSGFAEHPRDVTTPRYYGMEYEDVELITNDKVKLCCYFIPHSGGKEHARGTVILFHGNAMNHGDSLLSALMLYRQKFNVFTLEYRGYGYSEGIPSEKGLVIDAQTALDYVAADPVLTSKPIIIYGQSLGGGVAIDVTSRNSDKISALIIENTFTSIPDVVKGIPVLKYFSCLCTQRWQSGTKMARIPPTLPILMLSGEMDRVIPATHMQTLWDIASRRGRPKSVNKESSAYIPPQKDTFKSFPYGEHNTTSGQSGYWKTVTKFLDGLLSSDVISIPSSQPTQ